MKYTTTIFIFFSSLSFLLNAQQSFYDKAVPLNQLPAKELSTYLKSVKDEPSKIQNKALSSNIKPWAHSNYQVGYIPIREAGSDVGVILSASSIKPDKLEDLKKVNIRLDRLKIFDYPGIGNEKNIQLTFETQNVLSSGNNENVAFTQAFTAQEGEGAGITGYPIFKDLNIASSGLRLKVVSLNLKTSKQMKALGVLQSDTFKSGLSLLSTAQPAVVPFTALATGVAQMAIDNGDGVVVHKFDLGLDFDADAPTGARLKAGSYIVVQAPFENFSWADCEVNYSSDTRITIKNKPNQDIPFNYFIFRVTTK